MTKLEAIIRPVKLDVVKDALAGEGIDSLTISDVKSSGTDSCHVQMYRGAEYVVDFIPRTKIEIVLDDRLATRAAEVIRANARMSQSAGEKIVLMPVEEVIHIRSGERGEAVV